jgi:hypothetical protein
MSALIGCHPEVLFPKIFLGCFLSLVVPRGCCLFTAWGGITVGHKEAQAQEDNKLTRKQNQDDVSQDQNRKQASLFNLNYNYFCYFIISFINILTTDIPNLYIFSRCTFYFNFSTYGVADTQFHQDTLGSLKMELLQRRNM